MDEGQTKGQHRAKRDHTPRHPSQDCHTCGTLWGTLLGALGTEGMVAPATWTGFKPSHVRPGPSRTLHWRWGRSQPEGGAGDAGLSLWRWLCPEPRGPSLAGRMWHRSGTNWVVAASRVGLWCRGGSGSAEEPQPAAQRNRFSFPAGERRPAVWEVGQRG